MADVLFYLAIAVALVIGICMACDEEPLDD
jgi:hypothetical protein